MIEVYRALGATATYPENEAWGQAAISAQAASSYRAQGRVSEARDADEHELAHLVDRTPRHPVAGSAVNVARAAFHAARTHRFLAYQLDESRPELRAPLEEKSTTLMEVALVNARMSAAIDARDKGLAHDLSQLHSSLLVGRDKDLLELPRKW